jgi:hypothetical protein
MGCCHNPDDFYVHQCDTKAQSPQAGVHALVIGTSEYEYEYQGTSLYDDLDDIPGAAFGAAKFAKFLSGQDHDPSGQYHDPLGHEVLTVRLLLTPTADERPALEQLGVTWQNATYNRVRAALQEWYNDCDECAENITILYAAGHGVTDLQSFTHVFLKAEEDDEPDPFYYSLNVELIEEALEYNYSQTKVIISDCCHVFMDSDRENGIRVKPKLGRRTEFAQIHRKYDPLHITSARAGARTYVLGPSEGTMLSFVVEQLLQSAGRIVRHPVRRNERYFAIT